MDGLTIVSHPLVQHKLTLLRDRNSSIQLFRSVVREIATLLCYEVTRELPAVSAIKTGTWSKFSPPTGEVPAVALIDPKYPHNVGMVVRLASCYGLRQVWFTGDRVVLAYAQTVDVRGLKYPDIGQTMYRFAGGATATLETVWCMPQKTPFDIDERMSIIGTEGIIHVQDTFPNLGIVDGTRLHSPDTTYWPMFNGVRGGAPVRAPEFFADWLRRIVAAQELTVEAALTGDRGLVYAAMMLDPHAGTLGLPTIEQIAASYVEDLRQMQPTGPYYLGGYCFGGNVAYEMARQLSEQGQSVGLLALTLDAESIALIRGLELPMPPL